MLPTWRYLYSETPRKFFPPKDLWYSVTMIFNSIGPNEATRHSGEMFYEGPIPKSTGSWSPSLVRAPFTFRPT